MEEFPEYMICAEDMQGNLCGCGGIEQNVLKYLAVEPLLRGEGVMASLLSELIQYAAEQGRTRLMVFTKPNNRELFEACGFYLIYQGGEAILLENRRNGLREYLERLRRETLRWGVRKTGSAAAAERFLQRDGARIGCIVANCNPFTLGHQFLAEQAARDCELVHFFVLSDPRSDYSPEDRMAMVRLGLEGMDRILLHETSEYIISAVTFPTYFYKERAQGQETNCRMDLELFGSRIAKSLGISVRYEGEEPNCTVTRQYHERMREILPSFGIEVKELKRLEKGGIVSASGIRKMIREGEWEAARKWLPEKEYFYLRELHGRG